MTVPSPQLVAAEAEALATRTRLNATLETLQARLEPRRLARETVRDVTDAGSAAARRSVKVAQRNPGALAGMVAVAGLFLGRHRIAALFRRRR